MPVTCPVDWATLSQTSADYGGEFAVAVQSICTGRPWHLACAQRLYYSASDWASAGSGRLQICFGSAQQYTSGELVCVLQMEPICKGGALSQSPVYSKCFQCAAARLVL